MAFTTSAFAAFVRDQNNKAYLAGTALAALLQMENTHKAGDARKAIVADSKVFFGGDEKATQSALKSQLDAMANNWIVGGDVLRRFTADDKASLRRKQTVNGAVEAVIATMNAHMAALGFETFTYAQFRDNMRYASRAERETDIADKAAADAAREQAAKEQAAADAMEAERLAQEAAAAPIATEAAPVTTEAPARVGTDAAEKVAGQEPVYRVDAAMVAAFIEHASLAEVDAMLALLATRRQALEAATIAKPEDIKPVEAKRTKVLKSLADLAEAV